MFKDMKHCILEVCSALSLLSLIYNEGCEVRSTGKSLGPCWLQILSVRFQESRAILILVTVVAVDVIFFEFVPSPVMERFHFLSYCLVLSLFISCQKYMRSVLALLASNLVDPPL